MLKIRKFLLTTGLLLEIAPLGIRLFVGWLTGRRRAANDHLYSWQRRVQRVSRL